MAGTPGNDDEIVGETSVIVDGLRGGSRQEPVTRRDKRKEAADLIEYWTEQFIAWGGSAADAHAIVTKAASTESGVESTE